jgi:hypothetical protein
MIGRGSTELVSDTTLESAMSDPANILVFDCIIAALIILDLAWVLLRQRARSWLGKRITREQQPRQYRRYLYESVVMLGFCLAVFSVAMVRTF